jgi:hypothetical protein
MKNLNLAFILFVTSVFIGGCSDSDFQGAAPSKKKVADATPVNRTVHLTCDQVTGESVLKTNFAGEKPMLVSIEGEICGIQAEKVENNLSVFFILDFSGSMFQSVAKPGNDPVVGGSCGRLNAATAIATKMEATQAQGVNVQMGAMQFAASSLTHIPMTDLQSFKDSLSVENYCQGKDGTNYESALNEAKTQLQGVEGRKLVYFITDGAPTIQDSLLGSPLDSGLTTATDFRNSTQDLTFNAIYLNSGGPSNATNPNSNFDPKNYLGQIVGNPDNVKLVNNAADLAKEILEFETPELITLNPDSANMVHAAAKFGENDVKIESLVADPSREGVWKFVTEPILLFAEQGRRVTNSITLKVQTSDGNEHTASVEIEFEHTEPLTR